MENIKKESLFPWVFLNNYYEVDEFIPYLYGKHWEFRPQHYYTHVTR